MKEQIKRVVDQLPYIRSLRSQIRKGGKYPAGSYYSPIPDPTDLADYVRNLDPGRGVPGVDLRARDQFALLQEYARYYPDIPFSDGPGNGLRYHYGLSCFPHADAVFLYSFLRHFKPRRIIEIQTGASSGVLLDTVELSDYGPVDITFIDGYPENVDRLKAKLKKLGGNIRPTIVERWLQKADAQTFAALQAGDLLFISSSHVLKGGSDLQRILFEILPALPEGVFVKFLNVFYPFEYPAEMLKGGTYWNECYMLRAFLSYNHSWDILFFNQFVHQTFGDYLKEKLPAALKTPGTGLYLRRRSGST